MDRPQVSSRAATMRWADGTIDRPRAPDKAAVRPSGFRMTEPPPLSCRKSCKYLNCRGDVVHSEGWKDCCALSHERGQVIHVSGMALYPSILPYPSPSEGGASYNCLKGLAEGRDRRASNLTSGVALDGWKPEGAPLARRCHYDASQGRGGSETCHPRGRVTAYHPIRAFFLGLRNFRVALLNREPVVAL